LHEFAWQPGRFESLKRIGGDVRSRPVRPAIRRTGTWNVRYAPYENDSGSIPGVRSVRNSSSNASWLSRYAVTEGFPSLRIIATTFQYCNGSATPRYCGSSSSSTGPLSTLILRSAVTAFCST
jgi:hypothetical protein